MEIPTIENKLSEDHADLKPLREALGANPQSLNPRVSNREILSKELKSYDFIQEADKAKFEAILLLDLRQCHFLAKREYCRDDEPTLLSTKEESDGRFVSTNREKLQLGDFPLFYCESFCFLTGVTHWSVKTCSERGSFITNPFVCLFAPPRRFA